VVIATPWSAAEQAVKGLGNLAGKIVIDCTNPSAMTPDGLQLVLGFDTSAGEQVARWWPSFLRRSTPPVQTIFELDFCDQMSSVR
jgi:predicted dinucleotide-binding enzyme